MASGGGWRRCAPGRAPEAAPPAARPGGSDGSMVAGWGQVPVPAVGEGLEIDSEGIGFGRYAVVLVEVSEAGALRFQAAGLADMAWRRSPKVPGGDGPMVALLPGCGEVTEMSLEIDGEDSRFVLLEVEASGAGVIPAPGVRFEAAGLVEEAVLRDLIRLTPVQPVVAPGRGAAACAQALFGKTAVLVSELVPGAEEARGGSGTPCGLQGPFADAAKLRRCLLLCNREGTDEQMIARQDLGLDVREISHSTDDVVTQIMLLGHKVDDVDMLGRIWLTITTCLQHYHSGSDEKLETNKTSAMGAAVGIKPPENTKGSFCWFQSYSIRSAARVSLFAILMFLLIVPSSQLPAIDTSSSCRAPYLHATQMQCVDTSNTCPAPYLQSALAQFKRHEPDARSFEVEDFGFDGYILTPKNECSEPSSEVNQISTAGAIVSFIVANLAPLLSAIRITNAAPRRIMVLGISSLLLAEANLLWIFYLVENCATGLALGFAFFTCLCSTVYSLWFWWHTALTRRNSSLILLVCAMIAFIGHAYPTAAGSFGLTFTALSHISRIVSAVLDAQDYHWSSLLLAFCGGISSGTVLYTGDFMTMTLFKVASLVVSCARWIDVMFQLFFCCCKINEDEIRDILHHALLQLAEDEQV